MEATEHVKEQGLPCYKDRRMCVASSEALEQRAPSVKSKVTVPPGARSSHSGKGLPVVHWTSHRALMMKFHLQEAVATG